MLAVGVDMIEVARIERAAVVCHPHPLYGGTLHNKTPDTIDGLVDLIDAGIR